MTWRIASGPQIHRRAREVTESTSSVPVICGSWSDGPCHSGSIAYQVYPGANGVWVLESEVWNPAVDRLALDAYDAGTMTADEFWSRCQMSPDEARSNMVCREITAVATHVRPDDDHDAVVAALYDHAIAGGAVAPTEGICVGPWPSLDPTNRTVARRLRRRRPVTTEQSNERDLAPAILHQPFWCEENIWHLAQHPAPGDGERLVLVITGAGGEVACWEQRAGRAGRPILWDYHVVLAARNDGWRIWDLDSRLGYPLAASTWLGATFPCPDLVLPTFQPRFAVIPADTWIDTFGSDRSHMRRADGGWQRPPPPWPSIQAGDLSLSRALDLARNGCDRHALEERFGLSAASPGAGVFSGEPTTPT